MKKLILVILGVLLAYVLASGLILGGMPDVGIGVIFILGAIQLIGSLWALFDLLKSKRSGIWTLVWLVVIIFAPVGWLIYYFLS